MPTSQPLPLAGQQPFAADDFEAFESIYALQCNPIRVERGRDRVFGWRANYAQVGDVSVSAHETIGSIHVASEHTGDLVQLMLPLASASGETWLNHKPSLPLVAGKHGVVVDSSLPGRRVSHQAGYQTLNLGVRQHDLDRAFFTLTGETPRANVRFRPAFAISSPSAAPLIRLVRFVVSELEAAELLPMTLERLSEALLFQLLHSQPHNHSAILAAPAQHAEPAQVRRVADYLASSTGQPVRMSDLTRLTGTTARSIQAGFKRHRGCSPMEFLRDQRLERAHALLRRNDGAAIHEIARSCGFDHPGRFSIHYRERFGETPAQTRARRKPR